MSRPGPDSSSPKAAKVLKFLYKGMQFCHFSHLLEEFIRNLCYMPSRTLFSPFLQESSGAGQEMLDLCLIAPDLLSGTSKSADLVTKSAHFYNLQLSRLLGVRRAPTKAIFPL